MRRRGIVIGVGAVVLVLLVYALTVLHSQRDFNFGVVVPGVLMRSAQPTSLDLERILRNHGLKTIVNLRGEEKTADRPECIAEQAFAEEHGIKLVNIPLSSPPTRDQIAEIMAVMDAPANHPVLVHCNQGQLRTAAVVAVYGIERLGWSGEIALANQHSFKFDRSRPEKKEVIEQFILQYSPVFPPCPDARQPN